MNILNNLFPGLSFFGNTESTALQVVVDKAINSMRIYIKNVGEPEVLNFDNLSLFGADGEKLNIFQVCSIRISSILNDNDCLVAGNIVESFQNGIHTKEEYHPSIEITFLQLTYVKNIKIYNRGDIWAIRNKHLAIDVFDSIERREIWCNSSLYNAQVNFYDIKKWLPDDYDFYVGNYSDIDKKRDSIKRLICEFIDSEKLEDVLDSMPKVVRMLDMFGSKSIDGDDLTILAVYFVYSIKYDQPYRITFNFIEFLIPDEVRLNKLESLINTYCEKLNLGYFIFTKHGLVSRDLISRKDKYIEVLKNVSQTLRDNGRKNCILYGTLLGAVRNNSFIPYDDDVDLCVFSNATVIDDVILDRNEIVDILRINGFEVIYEPTNFWNIHVYSVENELTIDLFPIFIFGEKVILHMEEMKFREIPLSIIEPFSLVKLYDEEFFAPAKPEEFLYERYGNNWHISDRFFEFPYKISTNSFLSNDKVLIINDENNVTEIENNEDFFVSDVIEDVLWIDKPDWMDVLALRHRRGEFSDEMCDRIFHFIRDGFIVIPNAVDLETVHKVNEEINSKWEYPPKDLFIETFEPDSKINVIPADIEYKTGRTKMLDVYAHSDIVRSAINNEPTRQFLTAIFGDAPKAFQSLNFWFGSGQPIHKDSAYVKIDKEPTKFAASWIALEDIVVGSGELEYFVGSHKAPPYLFGGKNKWLESNPSEHNDFLISLYRDATLYNQTHQKFIARAGDVLIWHADLSHGGTKVIKNNTTRLSLVTHFTPKSSSPYFYRKRRFIEKDDGDMVFVSQYSDIN